MRDSSGANNPYMAITFTDDPKNGNGTAIASSFSFQHERGISVHFYFNFGKEDKWFRLKDRVDFDYNLELISDELSLSFTLPLSRSDKLSSLEGSLNVNNDLSTGKYIKMEAGNLNDFREVGMPFYRAATENVVNFVSREI